MSTHPGLFYAQGLGKQGIFSCLHIYFIKHMCRKHFEIYENMNLLLSNKKVHCYDNMIG